MNLNILNSPEDSTRPLCNLCNKNEYKYVCPRCNTLYCSVSCYKLPVHSHCSEEFYKENVEEALRVEGVDSESRNRMKDILKRVYEQDAEPTVESDDSDDDVDLAERLQGVDLDDTEAVWERLTDEERQEFANLAKSSNLNDVLPVWEPWWMSKHPLPKVRFVDDDSEPGYKANCPRLAVVPKLEEISKAKPSDKVVFNVINVVAASTFVLRYYNGQVEDTFALEAASVLIYVSSNLESNENFTSFDLAIESSIQKALACPYVSLSEDTSTRIKEDALRVIEGPNENEPLYYTMALLSEMYRTFTVARRKTGKPHNSGQFTHNFPDESQNGVNYAKKESLLKCCKKFEYYLAWLYSPYSKNL